jgi:nitric oxide reductase activation protein
MEMLAEMLSSADMLGKQDDADQMPDGDDGNSNDGFNKPQNPSKILQEKLFDGKVDKIPVRLETNVSNGLSPHQARKLYEYDCQDVREVSEAIEEALEILNRPETCWDEYSLRNGEIDEGGLHKLIDDSDDVFYRVETLPKMRVQVSLVLDESGSMACYVSDEEDNIKQDDALTKLHGSGCVLRRDGVARKLATAFAEGTKNIDGVSLSIYGHAGPHPVCRVYEYVNERTDESQFHRIAHITNRLHNYDGYAILTAGERMLVDDGDYDRRIMFIISDGEPSVSSYTGEEAQKHITSVVRYLNECGVETYTIGVDNAFPPGRGQEMYGENRVVILPNFDLSEVSAIISAFLEEISRS